MSSAHMQATKAKINFPIHTDLTNSTNSAEYDDRSARCLGPSHLAKRYFSHVVHQIITSFSNKQAKSMLIMRWTIA